ncbi:MAG: hypothetical protein F6J96_12995 [Symploca sp. SIO1C2]|nr:hypothetical protein [Symploca sp. SIO1C2]
MREWGELRELRELGELGELRELREPDKGRFFTFGLGQDKGDKEDKVTRE